MNDCEFCGTRSIGTVGGVNCCDKCARLAWRAVKSAANPAELAALNAREIVESVIDTLVEVGNGTTTEELRKAADEMFALRSILWPPPDSDLPTVDLRERSAVVAAIAGRLGPALARGDTPEALRLFRDLEMAAAIPPNCAIVKG